MTTGLTRVDTNPQRLMSSDDFELRLIDPLYERGRDHIARVYDDDGAFAIPMTMAGSIDEFSIFPNSPYPDCTDGAGHILKLSSASRDGSSVVFENASTIVYHVALAYVERPDGIAIGPRDGNPQYVGVTEDIGYKSEPNSVVDNGDGTITFVLNSASESGVDHSGSSVMVYKKVPGSIAVSETIAIETVTSTYSAPNNSITTVGDLGQSTISIVASDYFVVVLGPMVRRNTDLSVVDDIFYIGAVTGGGAGFVPTAFDTSAQRLITATLATINDALDGFATVTEIVDSPQTGGGVRKRMSVARHAHAAVLSSNGLIYVFAGGDDWFTTRTASVEAFDPSTGVWSSKTAVPSQSEIGGDGPFDARHYVRAVEIGDTIYLIGGHVLTHGACRLVQRYKPASDTWDTPAADLPAQRFGGSVGVINGKIYYCGGWTGTSVTNPTGTNETYEYDPSGDAWVSKATQNPLRGYGERGFATVGDRLYLFGGWHDSIASDFADIDAYSPATDSWSVVGQLPTAMNGMACAAVNGIIHIFGGALEHPQSTLHFNSHLLFNTDTNETIDIGNGDFGSRSQMTAVASGGVIYIMGGFNEEDLLSPDNVFDDCFAFDASSMVIAKAPGMATATGRVKGVTGAHSTTTNNAAGETLRGMPQAVMDHRVVTAGSVIYVAGGANVSEVASRRMWRYFPRTDTWDGDLQLFHFRCCGELLYSESEGALYYILGSDGGVAVNNCTKKDSLSRSDPWVQAFITPIAKHSFACEMKGRYIHVVGGYDTGGNPTSTYQYWSTSDDLEVTGPALPSTYAAMSELIIYDDVHYDDGTELAWAMTFYQGEVAGALHNGAIGYDSGLGTWGVHSSPSHNKMFVTAINPRWEITDGYDHLRKGQNNYVLLFGGEDIAGLNQTNSVKFTDLNAWQIPASKTFYTASKARMAAYGGVVYAFGGSTDGTRPNVVSTVMRYDYKIGESADSALVTNYSESDGEKPVQRKTVSFDTGDIYGQGTWDANLVTKIVKLGKEV